MVFIGSFRSLLRRTQLSRRYSKYHEQQSLIHDQLMIFPEYQFAMSKFNNANEWNKVATSFQRVEDVLVSTTGENSPLVENVRYQLSQFYRKQGKLNDSINILKKIAKENKYSHYTVKVVQLQLLSSLCLLKGDIEQSTIYAKECVQICEQQSHDNCDITIFSSSYSILGLASLFAGDIESAETYSQLALRWAQTPTEQLLTASNHGQLLWHKLHSFDLQQYQWRNRGLVDNTKSDFANVVFNKDDKEHFQHSFQVWNDALQDFDKNLLSDGNTAKIYGTLLCNLAEASAIASLDQTAEMNDNSQQLLSDAMNLIQTQINSQPENKNYLNLVEGIIGRILGMIGEKHFQSTQLVTAEGLFRAALEKLETPLVAQDIRFRYESAKVTNMYGQMLSKWEKRELVGSGYQQKAIEKLTSLPQFQNSLRVTPAFLFPSVDLD